MWSISYQILIMANQNLKSQLWKLWHEPKGEQFMNQIATFGEKKKRKVVLLLFKKTYLEVLQEVLRCAAYSYYSRKDTGKYMEAFFPLVFYFNSV